MEYIKMISAEGYQLFFGQWYDKFAELGQKVRDGRG